MTAFTSTFVEITRIVTLAPTATTAKSTSGASAVTRIVDRLTTDTIDMLVAPRRPGPPYGSRISAGEGGSHTSPFTSREEPRSFACVARSSVCSLALCASFCSASLGDTNPPSRSPWMRVASFATAFCLVSSARACMATAWLVALAVLQSSVASTSPFFTMAPGRTRTVSTYALTSCGPTLAAMTARAFPRTSGRRDRSSLVPRRP